MAATATISASPSSQLDNAISLIDQLLADLKAQNCSRFRLVAAPGAAPKPEEISVTKTQQPKQKKAKDKAVKVPKEQKTKPDADSGSEDPICKALLLVARVEEVEEVADSDKLLRCQVDLGPAGKRQVIAGLKKHIQMEELQGRLVCCIANLKAARLAGFASEAMMLAAVQGQPDGTELVIPLLPPDGSKPGDRILPEDSNQETPAPPKQLKSQLWRDVLQGLQVMRNIATYKQQPLCAAGKAVSAEAAPDGARIS